MKFICSVRSPVDPGERNLGLYLMAEEVNLRCMRLRLVAGTKMKRSGGFN